MITSDGKSVHIVREFAIPVEKLYKSWTDAEMFKKWWKDITQAEFDVRVGGNYQLRFAPADSDDYVRGTYREIQQLKKIVKTWNTSEQCGTTIGSLVKDSVITLQFKSISENLSQLQLTHDFLPADRINDHHEGWTWALVDADREFNTTSRQVDPALVAQVTKVLNFPIEKVYEAWTNPKMMNLWFNTAGHTLGSAATSMKIGGGFWMDYQLKTGEVFRVHGQYKDIQPLQKLVFTWVDALNSEASLLRQSETLVHVNFKDLNGKTEVSILHNQISSAAAMNDYQEGWNDCLRSMDEELFKLNENKKG